MESWFVANHGAQVCFLSLDDQIFGSALTILSIASVALGPPSAILMCPSPWYVLPATVTTFAPSRSLLTILNEEWRSLDTLGNRRFVPSGRWHETRGTSLSLVSA